MYYIYNNNKIEQNEFKVKSDQVLMINAKDQNIQ